MEGNPAEPAPEDLLQYLERLQHDALQLAGHLQKRLQMQPAGMDGTFDWQEWSERGARTETILAALQVSVRLLLEEHDPEEVRSLTRQLRRWRRLESREPQEQGWIEVRYVNGYGPYVYYRWRRAGEKEIRTIYYGRADRVQRMLIEALSPVQEDEGTDSQV